MVAGRAGGKAERPLAQLAGDVAPLVAQYIAAMDAMRFKEAIRVVMAISAAGNKFIQACCCPETATIWLKGCPVLVMGT